MSPLNTLIFGLGLFFLGLRLIGDNLHRLSGSGFRRLIKSTTHSPFLGSLLGLAAGALMQSATAVTFIMVSMTGSGLIKPRAAAPVIIWCNVGLTCLAFIATFDIHPVVAYVIGGAGIVLGTIRRPTWQAFAGGLLGLGLILLGLEEMSAGAAPLKDTEWFRHAISYAVASPPLAFLAGIAAAAILQSNTGTAMLVITFAEQGLIGFSSAMLLIYGANLGAIGLRMFLSSGLKGAQLRLVRLEDFFCILSGIIMLTLYALEELGIPLVSALVHAAPVEITTRLALVFFLSNFIPALVAFPLAGPASTLLLRLWPDPIKDTPSPSEPVFLHSRALDDPATALDLLGKELARLLGTIKIRPAPAVDEDADTAPANFLNLSRAIEEFATQLASRNVLSPPLTSRLHLLRAELSIVRHIEEGVRYFSQAVTREEGPAFLSHELSSLLDLATRATESLEPPLIEEFRAKTKLKGEYMTGLQTRIPASLNATALFEDFTIAVWTLHRLAKILARLPD